MKQPATITIDGPAGSGKSTLGELLARRLGYLYFDTGIMYRALTWAALEQSLDLNDATLLEHTARSLHIDITASTHTDGRQSTVLLNGTDVTWLIRDPAVDSTVSLVSSYPGVRTELRRQQRIIGQQGQVVMVGRDIGTVVMPDAPLKIYLHASLETRAQRRLAQLLQRGSPLSLEQVCADMARRDELDQHIMQPATDAIVLCSDKFTPEEEVTYILALFDAL